MVHMCRKHLCYYQYVLYMYITYTYIVDTLCVLANLPNNFCSCYVHFIALPCRLEEKERNKIIGI